MFSETTAVSNLGRRPPGATGWDCSGDAFCALTETYAAIATPADTRMIAVDRMEASTARLGSVQLS